MEINENPAPTLARCAMSLLADAGYRGDNAFMGRASEFKQMKEKGAMTAEERLGSFFLSELIQKVMRDTNEQAAEDQELGARLLLDRMIACDGIPDRTELGLVSYMNRCEWLAKNPNHQERFSVASWVDNIAESFGRKVRGV